MREGDSAECPPGAVILPLMGPTYSYVELDDRREFWNLLGRLRKPDRLRWLAWCCEQASPGNGVEYRVIENNGTVADVWFDAVTIFGQGRLTLASAGERLRQMANGRV